MNHVCPNCHKAFTSLSELIYHMPLCGKEPDMDDRINNVWSTLVERHCWYSCEQGRQTIETYCVDALEAVVTLGEDQGLDMSLLKAEIEACSPKQGEEWLDECEPSFTYSEAIVDLWSDVHRSCGEYVPEEMEYYSEEDGDMGMLWIIDLRSPEAVALMNQYLELVSD